jgi:hypothetical protein
LSIEVTFGTFAHSGRDAIDAVWGGLHLLCLASVLGAWFCKAFRVCTINTLFWDFEALQSFWQ